VVDRTSPIPAPAEGGVAAVVSPRRLPRNAPDGANEVIKHRDIGLSHEDRRLRARYLGALADRIFRAECARLGLNADEAITSPLASIIARQGRDSTAGPFEDR
jgi:hypothetical protein